jgi:hypothetical protein
MAFEDAKAEEWVFAGKRLSNKNTLVNAWYNPLTDELAVWKKFDGLLGGVYIIKIERTGDEAKVMYGEPIYAKKRFDTKITEWRVADQEARVRHQNYRRSKELKGVDPLDAAMERLLPYARSCRTRDQKDALIATVLRRLSETW